MIKQRIALLLAALMLLGTFGLAGCKKDEIPHLSFVDGNGNYVLDADRDLVADAPTDPALWRDPDVLTFSYAPLGSGGVYATLFDHFVAFLAEKTGKTVVQNVVEHESSAIIDMRDHKLDIGSFAAGTTCYAVNLAGYVPYAVKGTSAGPQSYRLGVVVAKNNYDSGRFTTILDMKGAYVAHATATSSSGHIAPLALLPQEGITPGVDYEIHFSGSHEASIYGVLGKKVVLGEDGKAIVKPDGTNELEDTEPYDFGCVAAHSSEFDRMVRAGKIKAEDFEFIWESGLFLTSSFGWAYDLHPDLIAKIKAAFDEYLFSEDMITVFGEVDGLPVDRFSPISYLRDYSVTRTMAQAVGTTFDEAGLLELIDSEANK